MLRGRTEEHPIQHAVPVRADHDQAGGLLGSYAKKLAIRLPGLDALFDVAVHTSIIRHEIVKMRP